MNERSAIGCFVYLFMLELLESWLWAPVSHLKDILGCNSTSFCRRGLCTSSEVSSKNCWELIPACCNADLNHLAVVVIGLCGLMKDRITWLFTPRLLHPVQVCLKISYGTKVWVSGNKRKKQSSIGFSFVWLFGQGWRKDSYSCFSWPHPLYN